MNPRVQKAHDACTEALRQVEKRIAETDSDFVRELLQSVHVQLQAMLRCLDPRAFKPGYSRPVLEGLAIDDPLADLLLGAAQVYERIRPQDVSPPGVGTL